MPLLSQLGKVWEVMLLGGHKGPENQPGDAFWLLLPTVYPPVVNCAVADGIAITFNSINAHAKPKICLQKLNDIQPLPVSILRICRSVDSTFVFMRNDLVWLEKVSFIYAITPHSPTRRGHGRNNGNSVSRKAGRCAVHHRRGSCPRQEISYFSFSLWFVLSKE